jgi:hypothetical protein
LAYTLIRCTHAKKKYSGSEADIIEETKVWLGLNFHRFQDHVEDAREMMEMFDGREVVNRNVVHHYALTRLKILLVCRHVLYSTTARNFRNFYRLLCYLKVTALCKYPLRGNVLAGWEEPGEIFLRSGFRNLC